MAVIVLTNRLDPTADVVVDVLNRRGAEVLRADLDDLEIAAELVEGRWVGEIGAGHRSVSISEVTGVYYRRPSRPGTPTGLDGDVARWVADERRWGVRGVLVALPRTAWLSWPPAIHAAEHKPYALAAAAMAGLTVPRTIVTNLPAPAADFARRASPVLYKAFRGGPVRHDNRTVITYATPVTADQIDDSVRVAPVTLQQRIDKVRDVRITYVDGRTFAVSPTRAGVAPLDWRDDHEANTWAQVELPDIVRDRLRCLCDELGLRFCAADFSVDHHGQWHHLDLNPVGQWAWCHPLRDSIAEALADALTRKPFPS